MIGIDERQVQGAKKDTFVLTQFEVAKPLIEGKTRWPEGWMYDRWSGLDTLVCFTSHPTAKEINGMGADGRLDLGLVVQKETILLVADAPDAGLRGDAPYSIHLTPKESRDVPPAVRDGETKAIAQVMLVDATTGIVKALRYSTLSNAFTIALYEAIRKQGREAFSPSRHMDNIQTLYARHPTLRSLMRASVARTTVGD